MVVIYDVFNKKIWLKIICDLCYFYMMLDILWLCLFVVLGVLRLFVVVGCCIVMSGCKYRFYDVMRMIVVN